MEFYFWANLFIYMNNNASNIIQLQSSQPPQSHSKATKH